MNEKSQSSVIQRILEVLRHQPGGGALGEHSAQLLAFPENQDSYDFNPHTEYPKHTDITFINPGDEQQRRQRWQTYVIWTAWCAISLLALYGVWDLGSKILSAYTREQPAANPDICNCGDSSKEALQMGCTFVPLSAAWLPPKCRDEQLEAEFDRTGPGPNGEWTYYRYPNLTGELTLTEMGELADVPGALLYMPWEWHVMHCVYFWKKLFRMSQTGAIMEPRFDTVLHIDHCASEFLETDPAKGVTGASSTLDSSPVFQR